MSSRIRTTLCVAVVGVLLSGALAWATGRRYVGTVQTGGRVKITTGLSNGYRAVKRFSVSGVPFHCNDRLPSDPSVPPARFDTALGLPSGDPFPTIPISYRRFHVRFFADVHGPVVAVKGQFNAKFSHATGTVSFDGADYPWTDCHSGKVAWTAR